MGTFRKKLGRRRKYKNTIKKSKMGRKFKRRKISKYTRKQVKKNRNLGSKKMLGGVVWLGSPTITIQPFKKNTNGTVF